MDDGAPAGGDEGDDAVQAFEALRKAIDKRGSATTAELKTIRKGVEALFDQIEALQAKPDYAEDLGRVTKGLVIVAERLKALEALPVMKSGINVFQQAAENLLRSSSQALDENARKFSSAVFSLEQITRDVRDSRMQRLHLMIAGGAGFIAGAVLLLFLPRLLPFDADSHVAAAVMGKPRWEAGAAIMQAANSDGWKTVAENAQLGATNADGLAVRRQRYWDNRVRKIAESLASDWVDIRPQFSGVASGGVRVSSV